MAAKRDDLEAENRELKARLAALERANSLSQQTETPPPGDEFLQLITHAVPGLISYLNPEEQYQFVNATYEAWYGIPCDQIIGRTAREILGPAYGQVQPYIKRVLAGERVTFETNITYPAAGRKTAQVVYEPHRRPDGQVVGFFVLVTDITERKRLELAEHILAQAGKTLAGSLDYRVRLSNVAELAVPHLADWCAVTLVDGVTVHNVAVAHVDPAKVALARELQVRYPARPEVLAEQSQPWQKGQSQLLPEISDAMIEASARDAEHYQILRDLQLRSAMVVPLMVGERVLGLILFVWAESDNRYDERDLALAEELARRSAIAIDNARAYRAEREARAQLSLLVTASEILIASPDYEVTLSELAHLIVPALADWCVVDVMGQDRLIQRLTVVHHDPAKAAAAARLQQEYPAIDPGGQHTVAKTLRQGQSWFDPLVSPIRLAAEARDEAHLQLLQELGFTSEMVVPLIARGRTLGTITLVRSMVEQGYQAADLVLAEELARRVALAVDNARLYHEAQRLNADLEQRVIDRTAELQAANDRLENEIAERQRAQAELAELQHRLLTGREAERLHLAQELHDGPVQELYSLLYGLNGLAKAAETEADKAHIATIVETTQQVTHMLRAMASELRPPTLAEFGLEKAIMSHAAQFRQTHPEINLQLDLKPDGVSLPEPIRLALFRVYQEALNNIIRHAQAGRVTIRFGFEAAEVWLEVEDNGRGFAPPPRWIELARQGHLGLVGMAERVTALGGKFDVQSTVGQGTRVRATVPYQPEA